MLKALRLLNALCKDEEGAVLAEYALLVALIATVCVVAVTQIGIAVSGRFFAACTSFGGTAC
jgi:pilus assembly protein Flp/PilA